MKLNLKKLLIITLSFMTIYTVMGEKCALASQTKTTSKTYTTRNSQGVATNKVRVYSSGSQVVRVDYYNSQGVRKGYTKVGR